MRILLIEDEPRIRAFLARGLGAEGFVVDESGDGENGLRRALEEEYDLVILDLLLPRLDGLSVLEALHERQPGLPVLILSARADLGVSVPLKGVPDDAKNQCSVAPCTLAQAHTTIKFSFKTGKPGKYRWQCFVPCAAGFLLGNGGPMQTLGYMGGFLIVK